MNTTPRTLRVKPLTATQKLEMINLRLSGVSAEKVARKYRISERSLATHCGNYTRKFNQAD